VNAILPIRQLARGEAEASFKILYKGAFLKREASALCHATPGGLISRRISEGRLSKRRAWYAVN
jgi:hypothetical protein